MRFRTKIFPGENTEVLRLLKVINRLKSQLHFLHVLKDAKPQARRALLTSADDDLIKAIVECAINTLNGNHKLTKENKGKLNKFKNRLRALVNQTIISKSKWKLLIKKRLFMVPLVTSICQVL